MNDSSEFYRNSNPDFSILSALIASCTASMRSFEVEVAFSQARSMSEVAAATFRGLFGWILDQYAPEFVDSIFKPGKNGNMPAGLVFRFLDPPSPRADTALFRITTFTDPDYVPAALRRIALDQLIGKTFGGQDTVITDVRASAILPAAVAFPQDFRRGLDLEIRFTSPFRLKRAAHIVGHHALSLPLIVSGALERLSDLCASYCHADVTDCNPEHFIALAGLALAEKRAVRWGEFSRMSSASAQSIHLDGCLGSMQFHDVSPELVPLLSWASLAHVGRHASAGNGAFECDFFASDSARRD